MDVVEWSRALGLRLKRLVLQCINGVSLNHGEGRTQIWQLIKSNSNTVWFNFYKKRKNEEKKWNKKKNEKKKIEKGREKRTGKCFITSYTRIINHWFFKRRCLIKWGKMYCFITSYTRKTSNNISYIGFRQVIRAHITCLCFIFPVCYIGKRSLFQLVNIGSFLAIWLVQFPVIWLVDAENISILLG
jgi:hypothetical protein